MCGIAVAIDWPDAELTVQKLIQQILHRGDITDPFLSPRPNTTMGTRRLRIVDGAHAFQPQLSFSGRLAVSFNGEIYNHDALRRDLADLGVEFKTESDTEVLANALQVWGFRALERVVGMYAFVALDISTGEFLAARDPFGVKPLYVIQSPTGFLFCSEMRPLLNTIERGAVMLLPPGYALSRQKVWRFNSPVYPRCDVPRENDLKALDTILADAVASRMPPGLPVATLFSGGIDSTLIAHYTRRFRPEAPGYFVGGSDAPDYPFAAAYAEQSGLDLRTVSFDPESDATFSMIDEVIAVTESFEPNMVRPAVCALKVSERMHNDGFRVALCGEGADELFCGYPPAAGRPLLHALPGRSARAIPRSGRGQLCPQHRGERSGASDRRPASRQIAAARSLRPLSGRTADHDPQPRQDALRRRRRSRRQPAELFVEAALRGADFRA
jgi:asparagine synthase (glutamine-hydrolysing)